MTSPPAADGPASVLAIQRAAFARDGAPALEQRRADLDRLKAAVLGRRVAIEAALQADFGHRSRHETALMEIATVVQGINYQRRRLRRWLRPERRHVPWHLRPGRAWISYQPLGVIGILSPWNFPLSLALMPVATALAAGNRAMLKPSEFAPVTAALLADLVTTAFTPDRVAVVTGDAAVARAFAALPFDHLLFTGSTDVGRAVMRSASGHLVPVTLELGGKSPVIVDAGQPLDRVAGAIAWGKLANAGQACIAPDYLLLPEGDIDAFVTAYDAAVRRLYPEGPTSAQYTAIIDDRQQARLARLLEDARARGATVREVGVAPGAAAQRPRTIAPTLVTGVSDDFELMRTEIFGPILAVVGYRDLDDAIARVNARPRPLALYYFGDDPARERRVLAETTSGGVTVNNVLLHYTVDDLPFGGVGASGLGAYHGVEGFRSMSHARSVYRPTRWHPSVLTRPPYGKIADWILRLLLR